MGGTASEALTVTIITGITQSICICDRSNCEFDLLSPTFIDEAQEPHTAEREQGLRVDFPPVTHNKNRLTRYVGNPCRVTTLSFNDFDQPGACRSILPKS
jgi:hypothetical protein